MWLAPKTHNYQRKGSIVSIMLAHSLNQACFRAFNLAELLISWIRGFNALLFPEPGPSLESDCWQNVGNCSVRGASE